ncbi:very short patch repair endonuclease [Pseudomonas syringae]|uniref:very short patch repair endonuclease n=1 Tax=Pseudomonas syringae TaxID=317 RepID=UPI0023D85FEE|nr:DNA mismatch endonuclease Vsr [Pseudomonas syringae]
MKETDQRCIRSKIMKSVGRMHTRPEIKVRQLLHSMGLRFRLHQKMLPGSPDIVLPKHKTAIFVHGCFWHRHSNCKYTTTPKTRQDYWLPKFDANIERDARKSAQLEALGWRVLVVWECETKDQWTLEERLRGYFSLLSSLSPVPQDDTEY